MSAGALRRWAAVVTAVLGCMLLTQVPATRLPGGATPVAGTGSVVAVTAPAGLHAADRMLDRPARLTDRLVARAGMADRDHPAGPAPLAALPLLAVGVFVALAAVARRRGGRPGGLPPLRAPPGAALAA